MSMQSHIDLERFRALEQEGLLFINQHPELPLLIHNYAQKAQYERVWTPETLAARGLITDLTGKVIARPFGKFFNLDEHVTTIGAIPNEPFEVFEKMDGSLGILYFHENRPWIATRGSFNSEQSIRANQILLKKYGEVKFDPALTYLFEIIYPENRIVVDYAGLEDLILLAVVETHSGRELPIPADLGIPVVKRYDGISDLATLTSLADDNKEGFVIRFQSGLRVKLKFEEYVRLHKVMTGLTKRTIWEHLSKGEDWADLLERVPDEFYQWVKLTERELRTSFAQIEQEARSHFREFPTRKEAAAHFLEHKSLAAILFRMMDDMPYDEIIWKMIRPAHQKAFFLSDEG